MLDDKFEMSDSTILEARKHFCDAVISAFGQEYLRKLTPSDIAALLRMNKKRGFPGIYWVCGFAISLVGRKLGMLGSLDCMHWPWKNCPMVYAGQYKGKEKKPTIVLEAWSDHRR